MACCTSTTKLCVDNSIDISSCCPVVSNRLLFMYKFLKTNFIFLYILYLTTPIKMLYEWYLKEREIPHVWMKFQRRWLNYKKEILKAKKSVFGVSDTHTMCRTLLSKPYSKCVWTFHDIEFIFGYMPMILRCWIFFFSLLCCFSLKHLMEINYLYYWLRKTLYIFFILYYDEAHASFAILW